MWRLKRLLVREARFRNESRHRERSEAKVGFDSPSGKRKVYLLMLEWGREGFSKGCVQAIMDNINEQAESDIYFR